VVETTKLDEILAPGLYHFLQIRVLSGEKLVKFFVFWLVAVGHEIFDYIESVKKLLGRIWVQNLTPVWIWGVSDTI